MKTGKKVKKKLRCRASVKKRYDKACAVYDDINKKHNRISDIYAATEKTLSAIRKLREDSSRVREKAWDEVSTLESMLDD